MACKVTKEAVKLIAEYVSSTYNESVSKNQKITLNEIAQGLYYLLKNNTNATDELIKTYLQALPDIITTSIGRNNAQSVKSDYNESNYNQYVNNLIKYETAYTGQTEGVVDNSQTEQTPINPSPVEQTAEGQKLQDDEANLQEQLAIINEQQKTIFDNMQEQVKESLDEGKDLLDVVKLFLDNIKKHLISNYGQDVVDKMLGDFNLETLYGQTGRHFFVFFDSIVKLSSINDTKSNGNINVLLYLDALQNIIDELVDGINKNGQNQKYKDDVAIIDCIRDIVNKITSRTNNNIIRRNVKEALSNLKFENNELQSVDVTGKYQISGNNAFFNSKEYYKTGFHRILFKCINKLARLFYNKDNKITVRYKAISVKKLLDMNLRIIGEGQSLYESNLNSDEKNNIKNSVTNYARRGVLKMIFDNLQLEEVEQVISEFEKSTNNTVPDIVTGRIDKKNLSYLSFLFMYNTNKGEFVNALNSIASSKLSFVIPIDEDGNPILFTGTGDILSVDKENKTKYSSFENLAKIDDNESDTSNNVSSGTKFSVYEKFDSKEQGQSVKNKPEITVTSTDNLAENKVGIVAIPLHSVPKSREQYLSSEVVDSINGIVTRTKSEDVEVGVSYTDSAFFISPGGYVYEFSKKDLEGIASWDGTNNIPIVKKTNGESGSINGFMPFQRFLSTSVHFKNSSIKFNEKELEIIEDVLERNGVKFTSSDISQPGMLFSFLSKLGKNIHNQITYEIATEFNKIYSYTEIENVNVTKIKDKTEENNTSRTINTHNETIYKYKKEGLARLEDLFEIGESGSVFETVYFVPTEWVQTSYPMFVESISTEVKIGVNKVTKSIPNSISLISRNRIYVSPVETTQTDISTTTEQQKEEKQKPVSAKTKSRGRGMAQSPLYGKSIDETRHLLEEALDWFENSPLSKLVSIDRVAEMFGDSGQFANIHDAIITLYQSANSRSVYHEAFHALTLYCMTEQDRSKFYEGLRHLNGKFVDYNGKTQKFSNASDIQLEEFLAESFARYMHDGKMPMENTLMVQDKTLLDKIKSFFDKIINWIKWHIQKFGGANNYVDALPEIEKLFKNLKEGTIDDYIQKFSLENAEIEQLNQSLFYADQNILSVVNGQNLTDNGLRQVYDMMGNDGIQEMIKTINETYPDLHVPTEIETFDDFMGLVDSDNYGADVLSYISDYLIQENVTNESKGFDGEQTYYDLYSSFTSNINGKYGIDENMSSMVMQYMKKAYINYVRKRQQEIPENERHGFMYYIKESTFLNDFKQTGLQEMLDDRGALDDLSTQERNIIKFINVNYDYYRNKDASKLGVWTPFLEYMSNLMGNLVEVVDLEDEIADTDDGEQIYSIQNEVKQKDNKKSLRELLQGEVKFLLSILSRDGLSGFDSGLNTDTFANLNSVITDIFFVTSNMPTETEFYDRINSLVSTETVEGDRYIDQLVKIIGPAPDMELYNKTNKTLEDDDRIEMWNLIYRSFDSNLQEAILEAVNVIDVDVEKPKRGYYDPETGDYIGEEVTEYDEYDYETGVFDDDGSEVDDYMMEEKTTKKHKFKYSIENTDQFSTELFEHIKNDFNSHEETERTSLITGSLEIQFVRIGTRSSLLASMSSQGEYYVPSTKNNAERQKYINDLSSKIWRYVETLYDNESDDNTYIYDFLRSIGVNIKRNKYSDIVFTKETSKSIIHSILLNICKEFSGRNQTRGFSNIANIIYGGTKDKILNVLGTQIDCTSSFSSMNGEMNMNNRHALNSFLTQTVKLIDSKNFKDIFNSITENEGNFDDNLIKLAEQYPDFCPFITSPYFDIALEKDSMLYKIFTNHLVVTRRNGSKILRDNIYRAGNTNFNAPSELKKMLDVLLSNSLGLYTSAQWADKEVGLSFAMMNDGGDYINIFDSIGNNESLTDFFYRNIKPYIAAEFKRMQEAKEYIDKPWKKYNGDRKYLKDKSLTISYFDEFFGFSKEKWTDIINNSDLFKKDGVNVYDKKLKDFEAYIDSVFKNDLIKNIDAFFKKHYDKFMHGFDFTKYEFEVGGKKIKSAPRQLINEYNKNFQNGEVNQLVMKHLIGSWLWHLNTCILITDNHNNYDSYSKRIGTAISTGKPYGNDIYYMDLLNRRKGETYTQTQNIQSLDENYTDCRDYFRVVTVDDPVATSIFTQEMIDAKLIDENTYQDMEIANAMGYVSFDTYRMCLQRVRRWSTKQEELFQKIINNQNISEQEIREHFPPLKLQDYAPMRDASISQKVLLKNQYLPLVPTAIKGKGLQKLHEIMMRDGIDFVTTKNGSKCCDKTDHQGDLSSLFRFGENNYNGKKKWNNSILPDSLRNVSIHAIKDENGNIVDIVKDNGLSAIENDIIYTEEIVNDKDNAGDDYVVVLKVNRQDGNIVSLERSYFDINGVLQKYDDTNINISDDGEITMNDKPLYISDNSFTVDAKYYRDQLEIHSVAGNQISVYTQFTSMASQNIFENGVPVKSVNDTSEESKKFFDLTPSARIEEWNNMKENERMKISENYRIIREFENAFGGICTYTKNKVFNKIAKNIDGKWEYNYDSIVEIIRQEANMSTDIPQSVYRDINRYNIKEYLNNSQYASPLMKLLIGRITKDLVKIKLYGDNLKQSPDLLFDAMDETYSLQQQLQNPELSDEDRNEIKAKIENKFKQLGFNTFKKVEGKENFETIKKKGKYYSQGMKHTTTPEESNFYHLKDGKMQPCKIKITFCDEFAFLAYHDKVVERAVNMSITIVDKSGNVLMSNLCKVVNSLLADNSFDDKEMDMFKCIGVRIPTQGYNFMDFMQINEFIDPALGPTIVLPKEMVEKNGSDYDIDNMPIMFPHIAQYQNTDGNNVVGFVNDAFINGLEEEIKILEKKIDDLTKEKQETLKDKVFEVNADNFVPFVKLLNLDEKTSETLGKLPIMSNDELTSIVFDESYDNILKELVLTFERYSKQHHNKEIKKYSYYMKNALTSLLAEKVNGTFDFQHCFDKVNEWIEKKVIVKNKESILLLCEHLRELNNTLNKLELKNLHNKFMLASYNLIGSDVNKTFLLKKSDTHYFTQDGENYKDNDGKFKYGIYKEYGFNETPKSLMSKINGTTDEKNISSAEKLTAVYNEFVRVSNNVSMTALGIAAVGTKWASILNEMGAVMKDKFKFGFTNDIHVTILLDHNEIDKKISLCGMTTIDRFSKFELFNELVSGFVDGAKDPWPAIMNFVVETTPIIEFMFWSGCKRDDIITLLNYKNIKQYVDRYREVKQGLGNYAKFSEYNDSKKKNGFLKDNIGDFFGKEFEKLYSTYEEKVKAKIKNNEKVKKVSVTEFAFILLGQIDKKNFDKKKFIANMFESNGKSNLLTSDFSDINNQKVLCEFGKMSIANVDFDDTKFTLTYQCYTMMQYLMLEKMSNDLTTFTSTFETDKNEYKTLAEINKYKTLIEDSSTSTFDYGTNFGYYGEKHEFIKGKFFNTNLGRRFFNDELSEILTGFFNSNEKDWRNNTTLNDYILEKVKYVKNKNTVYENLEDAKDKIYDYYFQNELVRENRTGISMNKIDKTSSLYNVAIKNGGYVRVINENGIYEIHYIDDILSSEFERNRDNFSCYEEFLNYVVERDVIYNLNKTKAANIEYIGEGSKNTDLQNVTIYKGVQTGLTGDILYDAILKTVIDDYNNGTKEGLEESTLRILADMAFNTYCSVLAMFKTNNFKALFKGFFDENISYAHMFVNMINDNPEITKQFPILKNLYVVKDTGGKQSLKLSRVIDTNRSNAQFGDEVEQIMDVLYGKNGINNVGILRQMFSNKGMTIEQVDNKVRSILNITSIFKIFAMLQAGCNISGKYGLAKFSDDKLRRRLVSDKIYTDIVEPLKTNPEDKNALGKIDRILAFKTGSVYGMSQSIGEVTGGEGDGRQDSANAYRMRNYSGDCLYDEFYSRKRNGTTTKKEYTWRDSDGTQHTDTYYVVRISETNFYVLDSNYNIAHEGTNDLLMGAELESFFAEWDKLDSTTRPFNGYLKDFGSYIQFTEITDNSIVKEYIGRDVDKNTKVYLVCAIVNGYTKFYGVTRIADNKNNIDWKAKIKNRVPKELSQIEQGLQNSVMENHIVRQLTSTAQHIPMPEDFLKTKKVLSENNMGKEMLRSMYPQYFISGDGVVSFAEYFVERLQNEDFRSLFINKETNRYYHLENDEIINAIENKDFGTVRTKLQELINDGDSRKSILPLITSYMLDYNQNMSVLQMNEQYIIYYINRLNESTETKNTMVELLHNNTDVVYNMMNQMPGKEIVQTDFVKATDKNKKEISTHNIILSSTGQSLPIIQENNTYYTVYNGQEYKFDDASFRFIDAFLDYNRINIDRTVMFKETKKPKGLVINFANQLDIVLDNGEASIVATFNGKTYSLETAKKSNKVNESGSKISPFFMNIYYTQDLSDINLKKGGYTMAKDVDTLFALLPNTKTKILIDENTLQKLLSADKEQNTDYLKILSNIAGISVRPISSSKDRDVADTQRNC